jgi:hypothetical protein
MPNLLNKLLGNDLILKNIPKNDPPGSTIEEFKSSITRRGGVAHENRFAVYMTPPRSVTSGSDLKDVTILCESCSLPGRQILTADYQSVKQAVKIPYGFLNEDVTFTFLLTNDYYIKDLFDKWSDSIIGYSNYRVAYLEDYTTDVTIVQLDKDNDPIYKVILHNAYPVTFNPITLDNNAENTVQKFTVTLTYENFYVNELPPAPRVPAGKVIIGPIIADGYGTIAYEPDDEPEQDKLSLNNFTPSISNDKPIPSDDPYGLKNLTVTIPNSVPTEGSYQDKLSLNNFTPSISNDTPLPASNRDKYGLDNLTVKIEGPGP